MKTRLDTCLLALFFWWLWIHRFYLWQGIWIVYILFCWTWVPTLLSWIEVLYFALMSQTEFDERYNMDTMIKKQQLENLKK